MNPKTGKPKDIGLDSIEKEVKRLQGRATTLQSKAIVRTDANVERTGSVVDILESSTQNIERKLHGTHQLVREMHLKMHLKMGINAKEPWPQLHPNGCMPPMPERNVDPVGSSLIFGGYREVVGLELRKLKKELVGELARMLREHNSTTLKKWGERERSEENYLNILDNLIAMYKFRAVMRREKLCTACRATISLEPKTRLIWIHLDWVPGGKTPVHRQLHHD